MLGETVTPALVDCIDAQLKPHSFVKMEEVPHIAEIVVGAVWRRRTWCTNRGVAILSLVDTTRHPGEFAQGIKLPLGKAIGYFPFFYGLGLQLVVVGQHFLERARDLYSYVDKYDNQRVVLQSIHLVDTAAGKSLSVRTWGQVITGVFQDAVQIGIERFLKSPTN